MSAGGGDGMSGGGRSGIGGSGGDGRRGDAGGSGHGWRERFRAEAHRAEPDLATLCLLIGAVAVPRTDEAALTAADRELDRLASEVARHAGSGAGPAGTPERWAWALREVLGARHGFHGRPADYDRLDASLLAAVLRRRRGLPILLSVVWTEVGRRAGAPVHGVGRPGHFVVGVGDPDGHRLLVDPFNGGVLLSPADAAGAPGAAGTLETVSRVLNNIRAWAAVRPEQSGVALWAFDLALLLPRHPARLRLERARLLVRRGEFLDGAAALESYAEVIKGIDPSAATTLRHEARAARAFLN